MIIRFSSTAQDAEKQALKDDLDGREIAYSDYGSFLLLERELDPADMVRAASFPAVSDVTPADPRLHTVREGFLRWTAAVSLVVGLLVLAASLLPSRLGPPADPLRTPADILPAWPMLAWHTLDDRAPSWLPVPVLVVAGSLVLLCWPFIAGRLAERKPAVHAAVGAVIVAAGIGMAILGLLR